MIAFALSLAEMSNANPIIGEWTIVNSPHMELFFVNFDLIVKI